MMRVILFRSVEEEEQEESTGSGMGASAQQASS